MAKKQLTNADVYDRVTAQILAQLDKGAVPWRKPWSTGKYQAPMNVISKKPYRGFNVLTTYTTTVSGGFESPFFVSFKQALDLGGNVKKGERSTSIMYWRMRKVKDKETGEEKTIPMAKYSSVFNIGQCENIDLSKIPAVEDPKTYDHDSIAEASGILEDWQDCPPIKHGGDRAFYSPSEDRIQMPQKRRFVTAENYYHTLFHEAIHSTGHESRLNREELKKGSFGNEPYSIEELTAEAGACLLSARSGIQFEVENSASYINSWRKKLGDDPKIVVQAFSRAQRAVDLIMGEEAPVYDDVKEQPEVVVATA